MLTTALDGTYCPAMQDSSDWRLMPPTVSGVPPMSRPRGWSGHTSSSTRTSAQSSGLSRVIASSSSTTARSRSTSSASKSELCTMSASRSTVVSRCAPATLHQ